MISGDVQFFQRGKNITKCKKDIKRHQVMPLLMHRYTARILAFVIDGLIQHNILDPDALTIDTVDEVFKTIDEELL